MSTSDKMPDHGGADAAERHSIEFDGFVGTVIGSYTTLEGKEGAVLQQDGTRVVHVYGRKHLKPAPVAADASAELQNDLGEMLLALGMSDAAQPKSPHDVFQSALAEMKSQIANASAEARLMEALENTNQLLIDVMHDQEADIRDRASKQFDKNIDALSTHPHASDCDKQGER